MDIDNELFKYATPLEAEALQAIIKHGECQKASFACGKTRTWASECLNRVKLRAAKKGYAPNSSNIAAPVPEGFEVKRLSARFDKEGKPAGGWLISEPTAEAREALLRSTIKTMRDEITPLPPIAAPGKTISDLLNVYTFTDYHYNMLAWGPEAGEDWDMEISSRTLRTAFRHMVDGCPPAGTCVIAQLGDFGHTDSFKNATPTSGHELDADSRFEKAVRAMLYSLRDLIEYAATRHDKVIVLLAEGNHDMASSVWFRAAFSMLYENNPRIEVIDSPLPFYAYEFGSVMLGWHHGHLVKNANLPLLFATDFAGMWGRTKHRVIHTGHYHHRDVKEHAGVEVYQHPTLAASDAYAARYGYRSLRRAIGITYHRKFGEWGTKTTTPEMLENSV